jgi:pimeloyl-ACP methyl ester carboxylesterase
MKTQLNSEDVYIYTGTKPLDLTQPSIVMVHGAQHDHSVWILQSRYLAHHGYNVLAIDLPGHGKSTGQPLTSVEAIGMWLVSLLEHLKITQCHWVGHSMGSLAVLEAASQRPTSALSLTLVGIAFPMRVSEVLLTAAKEDEIAAFDMINYWSHSRLTHSPGSPGPGFSVFNQNKRLMARQKPGVLLTDFTACNLYQGGFDAAKKISVPTHFILGQQDSMTPPKAASALFDALNPCGPTRDIISDCGHSLMSEQPLVVLASMKSHFAKCST